MKEYEREVGGRRYKIVRFGAVEQIRQLPDVLRFAKNPVTVLTGAVKRAGLGELGKMIQRYQKGDAAEKPTLADVPLDAVLDMLDPEEIGTMLGEFADVLEDKGLGFFDRLLKDTFVYACGESELSGDTLRPVTKCIGELFDENVWHLFVLCAHVIHVNFAPFLRLPAAK